MKFYEITNPYYALISAENIHEATKEYKEYVCEIEEDDDDEFNITEITKANAKDKYFHSVHDVNEECSPQTFIRDSIVKNILLVDSQLV